MLRRAWRKISLAAQCSRLADICLPRKQHGRNVKFCWARVQ